MKNRFWRIPTKRKHLSQTDREHLKRSGRYIPPVKQKRVLVLQPLYWVERRLESLLYWLKNLAFLEILQLLGNLSILFAVIVFVTYEQQQRNAEVYQAWQVITAAYEQPGSGGRIEALEFLNSEPRRNPWFWSKWERQSLIGLAAPKAYLSSIQLSKAKLTGANLQEADLVRANLQEADLWGANLQKAILEEANLQEADLWGANLQKADLVRANLQEADLWGANLQKADLVRANLQKADLVRANLQKADLVEADLRQAFLWGADLQGAILGGADLRQAFLREADLQGANLGGAKLQGAILGGADLQGAILGGAKLQGAILGGADLQGAILEQADLRQAQYTNKNTSQKTCFSIFPSFPCPTIFPNGFNPQAAGMVLRK